MQRAAARDARAGGRGLSTPAWSGRRAALFALAALAALRSAAQSRTPRIGFLGVTSATDYAPLLEAFLRSLGELGYEDGKNIVIDYRWAEGRDERLPELADQLARLGPEVIVTHAAGVRAAQAATSTIPIVMGTSADPVGMGLVKSLGRPGGNTTGVATRTIDLSAKRLELLKEIAPRLAVIGVLSKREGAAHRGLAETETAARALGVQLRSYWLDENPATQDAALAAMLRDRVEGLVLQPFPQPIPQQARIAAFAVRQGWPSIGGTRYFADAGGLASYGADFAEGWRIAARYVDKILKGAKPADLPVEQPLKFELAVNLKTARALGLAVPQSVLLRADAVIR